MEVPRCNQWASCHEWGWALEHGWNCGHRWPDSWAAPTQSPSPLLDHGFESDRSSVSTSSSVSSKSDRSGGSGCWHHGWCHQEPGGQMKINLPIFKDENKKDAVAYQSWHWDIMVYHQAGCWDHTLLPYVICSLQGYPGELVRSSGTNITLDGMIAVLDEHYNNVKALDALNQEVFQLWMADKGTVSDWGVYLLRHLQILVVSFSERFLSDHITELKLDCFYGGLPKQLKAMVAYLKATPLTRRHTWDYLQVAWEAEKEEAMETSQSLATASMSKPKVISFFPHKNSMAVNWL